MRSRLDNMLLLLRCAAAFVRRGSAKSVPTEPRTVAIVQFGKLGDMVCTTPMFRAIKRALPHARVLVVGDRVGGEVLAGNPDVDRYIVCGTDISHALKALREEHIDVGITSGPSMRAFSLLYLAGAHAVICPKVEGRRSSEGRLYRLVRKLGLTAPHTVGHYAPREYLRLLEPLGIYTDDTQKHLVVAPEAVRSVEALLVQEGAAGAFLAGIAPSAGNKLKNWPVERFAQVAEHLTRRHGATIVLVGGPRDAEEGAAMQRFMSPEITCLDTIGKLSMEELKALVGKLGLFVSVDTGPIYIAEALGVPTIDIVGPMDEHEQPPAGERHAVVVPPFTRVPELYIMSPGDYNVAEARRQVEGITAAQVNAVADELMGRIKS